MITDTIEISTTMPQAPDDGHAGPRAQLNWRWVGFCVFVFLILVLRRLSLAASPQFWAEDGAVWFAEQLTNGCSALLQPHAGYWQLSARLVAALAAPFPVAWAPAIYVWISFVGGAICTSLFALERFRCLLGSDRLRMALCLLIAAAFYSDEMVGTPTCLQWYLFIAALWWSLLPPAGTSTGRVLYLAFGFVCVASNPLILLFAPVIAAYHWWRRQPLSSFHVGASIGFVAQLMMSRDALTRVAVPWPDFWYLPAGVLHHWFFRVVVSAVAGNHEAHSWARSFPTWLSLALAALTAFALLVGAARLLAREQRPILFGAIYLGVGFAVPLILRGEAAFLTTPGELIWRHERLFLVPAIAMAFVIALVFERHFDNRRLGAALYCLLFVGGFVANGPIRPLRDLRWVDHVDEIRAWQSAERAGIDPPAVEIPINPRGWTIRLPAR